MPRAPGKDIAEIFGHAPDDLSTAARSLWTVNACPFVSGPCIKTNHDKTITYGVCSVRNLNGDEVITCPKRLYAGNYQVLRAIAADAFGAQTPFYMYDEFIRRRGNTGKMAVALGQHSGREVNLGAQLSVDWIIALLENAQLLDLVLVKVEIQ